MKLEPVTELGKRNVETSKNDNEVMSENCDVIFPIYAYFGAIRRPAS